MNVKNKITDLNNHLFAELERLGNEDLTGDNLKAEIDRAKAIASVSSQVVQIGNLAIKAKALEHETGTNVLNVIAGGELNGNALPERGR